MKKFLVGIALAALTLICISPVLMAGPRSGGSFGRSGGSFGRPGGSFGRPGGSFGHTPSTFSHRPGTFSHTPSTFSHKPSTFSHRPGTFSHKPTTFTHRPGTSRRPMTSRIGHLSKTSRVGKLGSRPGFRRPGLSKFSRTGSRTGTRLSKTGGFKGKTGSSFHRSASVRNYWRSHGHYTRHGLAYRGRNHHHWSKRSFWGKHRCWTFFCPSTRGWYYWNEGQDCYSPVSGIDDDPPAQSSEGDEDYPEEAGSPPVVTGVDPTVPNVPVDPEQGD